MTNLNPTPLDLPYNPEEKMLTPTQAAQFLGVSMKTISRYLNQPVNPIPCFRITNKIVRIKPADLKTWIDSHIS